MIPHLKQFMLCLSTYLFWIVDFEIALRLNFIAMSYWLHILGCSWNKPKFGLGQATN